MRLLEKKGTFEYHAECLDFYEEIHAKQFIFKNCILGKDLKGTQIPHLWNRLSRGKTIEKFFLVENPENAFSFVAALVVRDLQSLIYCKLTETLMLGSLDSYKRSLSEQQVKLYSSLEVCFDE